MFSIMATPVEGWKSLKRLHQPASVLNKLYLYPLMGAAALSRLAGGLIWKQESPLDALANGIEMFCSLFGGYFCVVLLAKLLLPAEFSDSMKEGFGRNLIAMSMATLAFFAIFLWMLPMLEPVLVFLPLWTLYVISKGVRFTGVPEEVRIKTTTLLSVLIIGVPFALAWVLMK